MNKGFDNEKYIKIQSKKIKERFKLFDKLYLEVGGKLFDDFHAARVLPGFEPDVKIKIFQELKDDLEIIFCINANDIERNKTRAEFGITYDLEVMRLIDNLTKLGFSINSVVITLYQDQGGINKFIKKLERHGIKTYIHKPTKGYPSDISTIVSEEGYGANPYIETTKKLILVNAPGPASGKLATCLSQLYHEHKKNINAGYAKFETFPVWDLALNHPVNMAYEAATADLKDVNMIDSFHLEKYGITAVNYNRDLAVFPVLKTILSKITNSDIYHSPTDMGVNTISKCITDEIVVKEAAKKEIVRRYYQELTNYKSGLVDIDIPNNIKIMMNRLNIDTDILEVVKPALIKQEQENKHVIALQLPNNEIITGKESNLLSAPSALIINSIKTLSKIPDNINLLSPHLLKPILNLRKENTPLQLQEVMIALSICSVTNPTIENALTYLKDLKNCEAHSTYIITNGDKKALNNLGIRLTCEPNFHSDNLFYN